MCGIAGSWFAERKRDAAALRRLATDMANSLTHRGPDDIGTWVDPTAGLALGFRRLSIQDLSPAGKQPMISACGRYVLVFNGEIYNFPDLRRELESRGAAFRGHSDTEVLLAAISHWGLERTLGQINGMFAFALWNIEDRSLTLARDRVGKKPLYYGWFGSNFMFGSELKALRLHPDFRSEIDRDALDLFLQYSWVPAPRSIYRGICKLPAGSILRVKSPFASQNIEPEAYWTAREALERGLAQPFRGDHEDAVTALERRLTKAVKARMISDVDLGALLSGGIDSSLIVALMQAQSARPIKTFTIGFHEEGYNEAVHAAAVAAHLGTDHTEHYVTADECLGVIPDLPGLYDEPFADSSQIPTFLVAKLARRRVTVALSGDGGDELFIGYAAYRRCLEKWQHYARLPAPLRHSLGSFMNVLSQAIWARSRVRGDRHQTTGLHEFAAKLRKNGRALSAKGPIDLYTEKRLRCQREEGFVIGSSRALSPPYSSESWSRLDSPLSAMSYLDFVTYLTDDILVKVDRASMGTSLEVRSPLLDRGVIDFAWQLPMSMKFDENGGKLILRDLLGRYLPKALFERPKAGFRLPLAEWLSGPLKDWAEEFLTERRIDREGYLNSAVVRRAWREQVRGIRDRRQLVWNILMFQAWLEYVHPLERTSPTGESVIARSAS